MDLHIDSLESLQTMESLNNRMSRSAMIQELEQKRKELEQKHREYESSKIRMIQLRQALAQEAKEKNIPQSMPEEANPRNNSYRRQNRLNRVRQRQPSRERQQSIHKVPNFCNVHNKKLQLYCFRCQKCICQVCKTISCKQHLVSWQQQAIIALQNQLVKKEYCKIEQYIRFYQFSKEILEKKKVTIQQQIDMDFSKFTQTLQQKRKQVIIYYDNYFESEFLEIQGLLHQLKTIKKTLVNCQEQQFRSKTVNQFKLFQKTLKSEFNLVKEKKESKDYLAKNNNLKEWNGNSLKRIYQELEKIEYQFEQKEKNITKIKASRSLSLARVPKKRYY